MKIATTNQSRINQIAEEQAGFILENIQAGMTLAEAVEAQAGNAMEDRYDEDEFDAPFDRQQLSEAFTAAVEKLGK